MLNKVELIGHLGKDIEVRTLENGTKVGTFSLATSESYKDKSDQWQTLTEWHNIVVWRPSESISKLYKGSLVHIDGKISTKKYKDKDGIERIAYNIVSDKILRLDRQTVNQVQATEQFNEPMQPKSPLDNLNGEIPF